MAHFGVLCPAIPGHLNPMCALGRALKRRGHRVTVLVVRDGESIVRAAGLEPAVYGTDVFPLGGLTRRNRQLGTLSGRAALRYTIRLFLDTMEAQFRDGPPLLREAGVEALLVDQTSSAGGTLADHLGIPFVTVCNALPLNRESGVPPFFTPWGPRVSWWARRRNDLAYHLFTLGVKSVLQRVKEQRRRWGLPAITEFTELYSPLAQISQVPAGFEFPRSRLPETFHFTGPFHDPDARARTDFPWEWIERDGRPLIYASMGTLQNRISWVFHVIAEACAGLDAQLVVSLGGGSDEVPQLPGNPLAVPFAPQLDLIRRAGLVITHAGLNTVLESLSQGVPLVAIPVANDQPGVAARLAWRGAGEVVPLKKLEPNRLRRAIRRVLTEPSYRERARLMEAEIRQGEGLSRAVAIIEQAIPAPAAV